MKVRGQKSWRENKLSMKESPNCLEPAQKNDLLVYISKEIPQIDLKYNSAKHNIKLGEKTK